MLINIDWISFTGKREVEKDDVLATALSDARMYMDGLSTVVTEVLNIDGSWTWAAGRKPYLAALRSPDGGISLYLHPRLGHFLVEMTGRACQALGHDPRGWDFLNAVSERLTRLDLAADMVTDVSPLAFVAMRTEGRFRTHSEFVSESGTTCYIGSRSSNRYCRVYRYNEPHERAHMLRAEFVVKAEDARLTARAILDSDVLAVAARLGAQFGFCHPTWVVEGASEVELNVFRPERREGKTLYWLADTIAPLLVRLAREGVIDPERWLRDNVLSKLQEDDRD